MDVSRNTSAFLQNVQNLPEELVYILRHGTNVQFLEHLSSASLDDHLTVPIFTYFRPLAFDICSRWTDREVRKVLKAFARVLYLFPLFSELARRTLHLHGDPLEGVYDGHPDVIRETMLALCRLLEVDNAAFATHIRPARVQLFLQHPDASIRHLAVRLLCRYLHASDAMLEEMKARYCGSQVADGRWDDRTIDYLFLPLWEDKRLQELEEASGRAQAQVAAHPSTGVRILQAADFHPSSALLGATLVMRSVEKGEVFRPLSSFVETPTTKVNLHHFSEALKEPSPILLTGLAGCGKTTLAKHAASVLGKASSMIRLHLNEQSDAKLLIGIYTTGGEAGSFRWQPGVLTTAVKEGRWVLVEDLDRAPNEIISVLLPLIERGELLIPSRSETIRAAPGFRLIASMRSTKNLNGQLMTPGYNRLLGKRLWRQVMIDQPQASELEEIVIERFSSLRAYTSRIMAVYERLTSAEQRHGSLAGTQQLRARPISPRELFKWTARINSTLTEEKIRAGSDAISEAALDSMFFDAFDCFATFLEDEQTRKYMVSVIADELYIDSQRRDHLLQSRNVELRRPSSAPSAALTIGRAIVRVSRPSRRAQKAADSHFAFNDHSLRLLEQVSSAVHHREPLLLVGETGIGKTAVVQQLAMLVHKELVAINLSQQSESGDLLGGFKPVNVRSVAIALKDEFDKLFSDMLLSKRNVDFREKLSRSFAKGRWKQVVQYWRAAAEIGQRTTRPEPADGAGSQQASSGKPPKRRKLERMPDSELEAQRAAFLEKVESFQHQLSGPSNALRFAFAEGKLISAVREGHWVLLDEINLASSDTVESLSDLLDSGRNARPSIVLTEAGQVERIEAHPDFRIFAAMNPASDVGKKDLPIGIRSRFIEIYVQSPDRDRKSLQQIVSTYLERAGQGVQIDQLATTVTDIYQGIQRLVSEEALIDGAGKRPHFSLRTLTRTLSHAIVTSQQCSMQRALYEGLCMSFFTALDPASESKIHEFVASKLWSSLDVAKAQLKKSLRPPPGADRYVEVTFRVQAVERSAQVKEERHWVPRGRSAFSNPSSYIITPYIARNLRNLIRATSTRKQPVLIQGPTSAGKTSMIEYLAQRSANKFIRINNHEHTDIQEYLGTYVSTADGKLVFQEGVLVQAVREGHWIVLDELNLAPSDVLEALNRLLDDNRELLIPETQEIIKPHPDFLLFATQNPAGPYGGRKTLSRAFLNRFVELHFDDIPVDELNVILARRSELPESWCKLIVEVYKRLSRLRQEQRLFEQNSFATLRDLFRWAFRGGDSLEKLAATGYMLLGEKVRKEEERDAIRETIEVVMSRRGTKVQIDEASLYSPETCPEMSLYDENGSGIIWTRAMRRLYTLTSHAIRNNEAVLLVGETGCGKTSVCQMLAQALRQRLHVVNAHQNTETGDLIGSQRPIRSRAAIDQELSADLRTLFASLGDTTATTTDLEELLNRFDGLGKDRHAPVSPDLGSRIASNKRKRKALFEWVDGSLVQAMRSGHFYLLDEISLADDSVLERMNSVLDPSRSILLAEKGSDDPFVTAKDGFQFFATMNPGGDYGKKELSPALRNRFTEIWVPPMSEGDDVLLIAYAKLRDKRRPLAKPMIDFAQWFGERFNSSASTNISIRDILAWIEFVNGSNLSSGPAFIHGAAMVFVDTLGANPSALLAMSHNGIETERAVCLSKLSDLLNTDAIEIYSDSIEVGYQEDVFCVGPFKLEKSAGSSFASNFNFNTQTARENSLRVMRALQVAKPVLLEGDPGVGKTSIVVALAQAIGQNLVRINLSEQTDLVDLFGSDVPVEGAEAGNFAWKDAAFLQAMKRGDWVLLDEMNLASQSVLEGLNACLDHRGEVYVAELDQTFSRHPNFKLFAAQNPHHQGGGRKGMPASFVNRFSVVYADAYKQKDLESICSNLHPALEDTDTIKQVVTFVADLNNQVVLQRRFGLKGAPWEFNLRDILRWLTLVTSQRGLLPAGNAKSFMGLLFAQRFREATDRDLLRQLFDRHFGSCNHAQCLSTSISTQCLQVGLGTLVRADQQGSKAQTRGSMVFEKLPLMESLMLCIQQSWPVVLVGPSGAGKTLMLQELAVLVGAQLTTFSINADIDASDLVGGYEQADVIRDKQAFCDDLILIVRAALRTLLRTGRAAKEPSMVENFIYLLEQVSVESLDQELCHKAASVLSRYALGQRTVDVRSIIERCNHIAHATGAIDMAKFEWVDGVLVKALEEGHWLVLDNANLCSSSVLDRLNSLLEPHGSLIVSEHCNADGSPKIITPHPDFRMFLTLDPQFGELSRAMRNRAVELFMPAIATQHPVQRRYASVADSSMMRFNQLLRTDIQLSPLNGTSQYAIQTTSECLSMQDLKSGMLDRFVRQLSAGLGASGTSEHLVTALKRLEGWLARSFYRTLLRQAYTNIDSLLDVPGDYLSVQPIHPLSNPELIRYSQATTRACDLAAIGRLADLYLGLIDISFALEPLREDIRGSKQDLTRLARSFASSRTQQVAKDSTVKVGSFLDNTVKVLFAWLEGLGSQGLLLDIEDGLAFTSSIIRLLWNLIDVTNAQVFDEATFQIVLSMGRDQIRRASAQGLVAKQLVLNVEQQVRFFAESVSLKTGLSMERMWKAYQPAMPGTLEGLQALQSLDNLVGRFAQLMWQLRVPVEELAKLWQSLRQTAGMICSKAVDATPLLKAVDTTLTQQMARQDDNNEHIAPFFKSTFEAFRRTWDLQAGAPIDERFLEPELRVFSVSTNDMRENLVLPGTPLASLRSLSQYGSVKLDEEDGSLHADHVHLTLLKNLDDMDCVGIRQLSLLQSEVFEAGKCIAKHTNTLSTSIPRQLARLLVDQISSLLSLHSDRADLPAATTDNLHRLDRLAEKLDPDSIYETSRDWLLVGRALINFGTSCLTLYVPDKVFDPALRSRVERHFYDKHHASLTRRLEAYDWLQGTMAGTDFTMRREMVLADIQALGPVPEVMEVARPAPSRLDEVQVEFSSILRLVGQIEDNSATVSGRPSPYRPTLSALIDRLKAFWDYEDMVAPVRDFLGIVRTGFLALERSQLPDAIEATSLFEHQSLAVVPLMGIPANALGSKGVILSSQERLPFTLHIRALQASLHPPGTWSQHALQAVQDEFDRQHGYWKMRLEKDQKANERATSFYQYKGGHEEDQEVIEKEFEELFPSFESQQKPEATAKDKWDPRRASILAAEMHLAIFQPHEQPEAILERLMRDAAVTLAGRAAKTNSDSGLQFTNAISKPIQHLPAIFLLLQEANDRLHESRIQRYNIYNDPNVGQMKKLTSLIFDIQDRFHSLVEAWPEHSTLHNVLALCRELLACRYSEPIMKIMPKLEQLHATVNEWQSLASREYSVSGLLNQVTEVIIGWRQLELTTWARLLDLEDERCADDAKTFWFLAYGTVMAPDIQDHVPDLLQTLHDLMTNSSLGQYGERLKMLRSLAEQLRCGDEQSVLVADVVDICCSYFSRYQAHIGRLVADRRKELEKALKEVLQLASWRDRNIASLKQSAQASHRKLFRIVKKYRDLLSQPVVLQASEDLDGTMEDASTGFPSNNKVSPVDKTIEAICQNSDAWVVRPARFRDTPATASMIMRMTRPEQSSTSVSSRVDEFVDSLEAAMGQLQRATPNMSTEENTSTIKHLTVRKRRLFADTLKDLRQMGFSSNMNVDALAAQSSVAKVLASTGSGGDRFDSTEFGHRAQHHLFQVFDDMDRVRAAAREHHDDMNGTEVSKCIGYAESLLAICLKQRNALKSTTSALRSVEDARKQIDNIWQDGELQISLGPIPKGSSLESRLTYLPTVLRVAAKVLAAQSQLGSLDFTGLLPLLQEEQNSFEALRTRYMQLPSMPAHLTSVSYATWSEDSKQALQALSVKLEQQKTLYPDAKGTLDHFLPWTEVGSEVQSNANSNGFVQPTIGEFEKSHFQVLDSILGCVQDVERSLSSMKPDNEDPKWLVQNARVLDDALRSFRLHSAATSLQALLDGLHRFSHSEQDLRLACASLHMARPILQQYESSSKQILDQYSGLHASTCRMAERLVKAFVQLSSQGFCKPAEKSDEKGGQTEKLESGTGLGEGEGAEDISKDIGGDEDLSDLAQDQQNQTTKGDMENQDDAVDIEDALEGAAGEDMETKDMEDGKEKAQDGDRDDEDMGSETGSTGGGEGGEAEEGNDSAENEVGDVDELEPSAVDEKMWDQAGDESKQEKEGKQASKQTGKDEDTAAGAEGKKQEHADSTEEQGEADAGEDGQASDVGDEEAEDGQEAANGQPESMDPYAKEEQEGLELPEDMQLDGDKGQKEDLGDMSDGDHLDDLDDLGETERAQEQDGEVTEDEEVETSQEVEREGRQDEQEPAQEEAQADQAENDGEAAQTQQEMYGEADAEGRDDQAGAGATTANLDATAEEAQTSEATAQGAGPDDADNQNQASASAAQRSSGVEAEALQRATGPPAESGQTQSEPSAQEARDSQMIKKLGDVLEKWHRQHRDIQQASEQQPQQSQGQQEDADMTGADFEHLPDDDAEADTQALGTGTQEQARPLDERMAQDAGGSDEQMDDELPLELPSERAQDQDEKDVDMPDAHEQVDGRSQMPEQDQRQAGAFMGERKSPPPQPDHQQALVEPNASTPSSSPSPPPQDPSIADLSLTTRPPSPAPTTADPTALWTYYTSQTQTLALTLTEQLRLILEPTRATKLRGDFRTGKRLNIKRIIPYIASGYKRDKIWMRRSVPSKREYQIMLAIDDSGSMGEHIGSSINTTAPASTGETQPPHHQETRATLALLTLSLLSTSLSALEIPTLSILGFGAKPFIAHDFSSPFHPSTSGPESISHFTFKQTRTDVLALLRLAREQFGEARLRGAGAGGGGGGAEQWQLMLIIGDGVFEGHEACRREVVGMGEERILPVFIIVDQQQSSDLSTSSSTNAGSNSADDSAKGKGGRKSGTRESNKSQSILDLETVEFVQPPPRTTTRTTTGEDEEGPPEPRLVRRKYLDTFPFQYYLIVRDVRELPGVLATALRQWFAEVGGR